MQQWVREEGSGGHSRGGPDAAGKVGDQADHGTSTSLVPDSGSSCARTREDEWYSSATSLISRGREIVCSTELVQQGGVERVMDFAPRSTTVSSPVRRSSGCYRRRHHLGQVLVLGER